MKENNIIEEKIKELQILEDNLHNFALQKHNFQTKLLETESALSELKDSTNSFKIIGNIIVEKKTDTLINQLEEAKEKIEKRMNIFQSQEDLVRKKIQTLQEEVNTERK